MVSSDCRTALRQWDGSTRKEPRSLACCHAVCEDHEQRRVSMTVQRLSCHGDSSPSGVDVTLRTSGPVHNTKASGGAATVEGMPFSEGGCGVDSYEAVLAFCHCGVSEFWLGGFFVSLRVAFLTLPPEVPGLPVGCWREGWSSVGALSTFDIAKPGVLKLGKQSWGLFLRTWYPSCPRVTPHLTAFAERGASKQNTTPCRNDT